nr:MAG TPA: hypothetical protein [Bacteriophage sp.]
MNIRSVCVIIITDKRITFLSTGLQPLSSTQGRGIEHSFCLCYNNYR